MPVDERGKCKLFCSWDSEETQGNTWGISFVYANDVGKETVFPTKAVLSATAEPAQTTDEAGAGAGAGEGHTTMVQREVPVLCRECLSQLGLVFTCCGHIFVLFGWLVL